MTRLEVGYAAKTGADLRTAAHPLHRRRSSTKPPAIEDRAVAVQMLLAATAELAGLTVLPLDMDFDRIADVTGQPTERLAPA